MDEREYRIQQCFHCGNKGLMRVLHQHKHEFGGPVLNGIDGDIIRYDLTERFDWILLECPICNMVTLRQTYCDESTCFNIDEVKILYPENSVDYYGIPDNIKAAFESALKVKNIDTNSCLLSLRRVLEIICKDQGAEKNNLESMIKELLEKGKLPPQMEDACWIIRQLGNKVAHSDNVIIYSYKVDQTINFLETIMGYLYTLPKQMKELKSRIEDGTT